MKISTDHKLLRALLLIAISIGAVSFVLPAVPLAHASPTGPCAFVPTTSPVVYITNSTGTGSSEHTHIVGDKVTFHVCVANVGPFNRWAVKVTTGTDAKILNPQTPGISLLGSVLPNPLETTDCINGGSAPLGAPGNLNCIPDDGVFPLSSDPAISFVDSPPAGTPDAAGTWTPTKAVIYDQNSAAVSAGTDNATIDAAVGIYISPGSVHALPDIVISGAAPANATNLSLDPLILYVDADNNAVWDPGETVVYDADNSGTFTAGDTLIVGTAPPSCAPCGIVDSIVSNSTKPSSISVGSMGALLFSVNYTQLGGPGAGIPVQLKSVRVSEGNDPIQVSVQGAKLSNTLSTTVPDFSLRVAPLTRNYLQGGNMNSTLTLTSVNITSSKNPLMVTLSASVPVVPPGGSSPPGPTPLLGPLPVKGGCNNVTITGPTLIVPVPANGSATACMQVSAGFDFTLGSYTVKVTATATPGAILVTHSVSRIHTAFLVHNPGISAATIRVDGFYGPARTLLLDAAHRDFASRGETVSYSVDVKNLPPFNAFDVAVGATVGLLTVGAIVPNPTVFSTIPENVTIDCINGGLNADNTAIPLGQPGNIGCRQGIDIPGVAHMAAFANLPGQASGDKKLFSINFLATDLAGSFTAVNILKNSEICFGGFFPPNFPPCTLSGVIQPNLVLGGSYGTTAPDFVITGPAAGLGGGITIPQGPTPLVTKTINLVALNGYTAPVNLATSLSPSGGATSPPICSLSQYTGVVPTPSPGTPITVTVSTSQTTSSTAYACTVTATNSTGSTRTLPISILVTPVGQPVFAKAGVTVSLSKVPLGGDEFFTALVHNPTITAKWVEVLATITRPDKTQFVRGCIFNFAIPTSFDGQCTFDSGTLSVAGTYTFAASIVFADTPSPLLFTSTSTDSGSFTVG